MAKSGLRHIDVGAELTKTEWESEDSHELLHGNSFPSSPVERQLFYRDDEHKWYIYSGTEWVWLGGGGGGMQVHGNEYHDPDFEQQGVAATLVETHRTTATHTQPQPAAEHGNEKHNPDFAEASHTHSDLSPAHKDVTTGVHGVGAGTIAKVGDIAVDSNLSSAAQDAIAKKHTQGTDTALGAVGTKNPPIDADKALYRDSEASDALKTSTWTQIKAFLKTYFDTLYATLSHTHGQLHDRLHSITSTSDHSSSATSGKMLKADSNGLPVNATNTDTEVSDAVTKKHTQLCEAADFTKLDGIEAGADVTANHAPQAHKTSHQDGGADEISIEGLAGSPAQKAQASGLASLNASSKVAQQPAAITDHLTGTPADAETTKAPTSDWAYDHKADKAAHHSNLLSLTFIIDGGGSAITTGQKGHLEIPFACTITGWTLLANQSGSIVIDVWKDTYANFPPTVADTIAGSEKPTLSSAQKNQDLTLTTWTTAVAAGDILAFNVDSVSTVTRVILSIRAEKS